MAQPRHYQDQAKMNTQQSAATVKGLQSSLAEK